MVCGLGKTLCGLSQQEKTAINNTQSEEGSFKLGSLKKKQKSPLNSCRILQLESIQADGHSLVAVVSFLAIFLSETKLAVINRKNGV